PVACAPGLYAPSPAETSRPNPSLALRACSPHLRRRRAGRTRRLRSGLVVPISGGEPMARKRKSSVAQPQDTEIPAEATGQDADQKLPSMALGDSSDIHAAGTAGGGSEVGGLAGTNVGDGDPDNADLERAFGSGIAADDNDGEEDSQGYRG